MILKQMETIYYALASKCHHTSNCSFKCSHIFRVNLEILSKIFCPRSIKFAIR